ncbi:MAG: hypothetical protein H6555_01725 [Lewinellaceae bacterium]|nr:hypothetical protein [Lewinellaceae bacterium]
MLAFFFFGFVAIGTAQSTATPVVKERQENQRQRVKQGVKSGELTARETKNLAKQQKEVNQAKRQAKSDGVVTTGERVRIQHKQNQASRNIARKKHNGRDRNN